MNQSKQLSVIEKATVSKPTKDEIITAMAMIKIEQLRKEQAETDATRKSLTESYHSGLLSFAKDNFDTLQKDVRDYRHHGEIEITIGDNMPAYLKRIKFKMDSLASIRIPELREAKKQIREAMAGYTIRLTA